MIAGRTMQFPVAKVLETLKANREKHIAAHEESKKGYLEKRGTLALQLAAIQPSAKAFGEKLSELHSLPKPQSHVDEYDRAIQMLEFTSQDTIDLTSEAFDQYIRDEWNWKKAFAAANTMYGGARAAT